MASKATEKQPDPVDEATGLPALVNGGTVDVTRWAPVVDGQLSPQTAEAFVSMAWTLPRRDTSDATDKILAGLLTATTPDAFNEAWQKQGVERYFGRRVVVERVFLLESKYREGAGVYLRAEGYDHETEQPAAFNTSSWAVMGALIGLHVRQMLPAVVVPAQSAEPTADGYRPHHLEVLSTARRGTNAPAQ